MEETKESRSLLKRSLVEDSESNQPPEQKRPRFPKGNKVKKGDEITTVDITNENELKDYTNPKFAAKERAKRRSQFTTELFSEQSTEILKDVSAAEENYELNDPFAKGMLSAQFRGRYVELSVQKHSSHVVEKCLRVFDGYNRRRIIQELLHTVNFYYLLQHEYANYVIQSALDVSEGDQLILLVEAIRPYGHELKSNPHSKRIYSKLFES